MSTDLRALLRSLADDMSVLDNRIALADATYSAGRRRRRVRRLEISGGTAVVVVSALFATLFVGSKPLAAEYGTSSGTRVSGHPSHIGRQFPILDLPARPGPIAGVFTDGQTTWAVSATGHRWRIAGDGGNSTYPTAVSPDGRMIAYLRDEVGPLLIHDLVAGTITAASDVGHNQGQSGARYGLTMQFPSPHFSSDDRYLAVEAFDAKRTNGSASMVIVSTQTGKVVGAATVDGNISGWTGDRLVKTATAVETRSVDLQVVGRALMRPTSPLGSGIQNGGNAVISTDGKQWIHLSGGDSAAAVTRFDLATGAQLGAATPVPPATYGCGFAAGVDVVYTRDDGAAVITVRADGKVRTATTIDPALKAVCGSWASDAFDGAARGGLIMDRLIGAFLNWWQWLAWTSGALLVLALATRRVRVHSRSFAASYPQITRTPMTSRRKRTLLSVALSSLLVLLAVLTPFVFLPLGTADLRVGQGPVVWFPVDEQAATSGGFAGRPAVVLVSRLPQQGFAVLVENHSGFDQTVSDSQPVQPGATSDSGLTVATTAGTAAQVRSLTYQRTAVIPAHQQRWVRELTSFCVDIEGGYSAQDAIELSVKIGWITRTEGLRMPTTVKTEGKSDACS